MRVGFLTISHGGSLVRVLLSSTDVRRNSRIRRRRSRVTARRRRLKENEYADSLLQMYSHGD